jgi:hypothetical protein
MAGPFQHSKESAQLPVDHAPNSEGADADRHSANAQRHRSVGRAQLLDIEKIVSLILLDRDLLLRQSSRFLKDGRLELSVDQPVEFDFGQVRNLVCF